MLVSECLGKTLQIKRRRKRPLPPEPYLDESCMRTVLGTIVPLPDIPFSGDGTGEGCSSLRNLLTSEEQVGKSGTSILAPSQAFSHSAPPIVSPSHKGQPITVHEFLQGVTGKSDRKYGRRRRLGTVKLDVSRREACLPTVTATPYSAESQSDRRTSESTRIQLKHAPRRVPRLQQKEHFAKSLAQRLFEGDVFSSGTSSRPKGQNPPHISSRQPLQFVTSSNLTPSLESRIRKRRQVDGARQGSHVPAQMLAVPGSPATSPNPAPGGPPSRNGATTTQRARTGSFGAVLASRRNAFCARGGGKQNGARSPPGPFEYIPLPLVQVKTHQGAMPFQYPVACSGVGLHAISPNAGSLDVLQHSLAL
jgi:hypothetical protein